MTQQDKRCESETISPEQTTADLVIRMPYVRPTLERLGIDYCCGGQRTLAEAAQRAGVAVDVLLAELHAVEAPKASTEAPIDWSTATITHLADHVLDTHHTFTKSQLERIHMLLTKVAAAHSARHGALLDRLEVIFSGLRDELESHLMKEEQILFPAIKAIDAFYTGHGPRPVVHCGSVEHPIRQMGMEHDDAGAALAEMRRVTGGYQLPQDACQTFAALYEAIQALEADLHQHIHLENNILFPASLNQEQEAMPSDPS